jgi:dTDP-4-amino-4,6-dideoxygalactose transaminase
MSLYASRVFSKDHICGSLMKGNSMKNIPLVDLKAGFEPIRQEVMQAIESVFAGMNLYLGPNVSGLEEEFSAYCKARYAIGVGSGTEAIQIALLGCGIGEGDEVITTPNTFFATVEAIAYTGATPVFVDIDPRTFTIDVNQIEQRISKKTRAIIPVHMYGQSADMDPVMELAQKHGIRVIEDACQAHGAEYKNRKCGAMGDAGCFSFYFTKNLGGYGEGGIAVTGAQDMNQQIRLYRNHGHTTKFEHTVIGYNSRLDEIQAAILRVKLKYLDAYNDSRRRIAALYGELLKDTPLQLPEEAENRRHVYHLYVVRTRERERLQEYLSGKGVGTGIHYKLPIHLQEACRKYGYRAGDFPEAERASSEILSLPIYPELGNEDIGYIAETIKRFYE